jgi:hypothetical protein
MFAKDKISQSMINAVSSIMNEAEKPEDSKPTGKKPDWLLAAELRAEKKTGKLKESEKLDEIDANAILGMAKKITPNARIVTTDQKKKEREELDAKRAKEAEGKPKSTGYVSPETKDFGKNRGYGQGRYMGDSVEINDELVEAENVTTGKVKKIADKEALKIADKEVGKHEKSMHDKQSDLLKKESDQRFIDAVTKVIYGGKGVMVDEDTLAEKDELRDRIGTNIVNKKPREGQTDLRNIPAGNRPDGKNKFSQSERDSQPTRLKNSIKASLGKHSKPNLPEEVEQMDEGKSFPATRLKDPMDHLKDNNPHDKKTEIGLHRAWLNGFKHSQKETERNDNNVKDNPHDLDSNHRKAWRNGFVHHDSYGESHPHDSHPYEKKSHDEFKEKMAKYKETLNKEEVEDAFTAYKNKRPSELGRHLTRTHDSKRLSDTSVMYTKKHGKDLESAKDAGDAHNASVYAKQKMKKEENENEGLAAEATTTHYYDKNGKKTGFKYEGDWVKKTDNKEGRGKVTNMAGRAMQKAKELAKEDAQSYVNDDDKPKTTDTLAGRIKVPKKFDNQHISRKVELKAEESHPDAAEDKKLIAKMIKKDDAREEAKDKKEDAKMMKKIMHREETEFEHIHGEHLKVHSGPHKGKEGTLDDIHGHIFEIKPHGAKSEREHIYVPQHHTTIIHQNNEAFHGPEAGSGTGDSPMVTNNSKPVKLAKYLAVKTADKMKNEMLGKMTN